MAILAHIGMNKAQSASRVQKRIFYSFVRAAARKLDLLGLVFSVVEAVIDGGAL